MGREVRRVPPNWEHPRLAEGLRGEYRPCYDRDYETAAKEWAEEFLLWHQGKHPSQPCDYCRYFWDYFNPPDEETCRPAFTDEPTWWQVYETVSEGTPVSPPFATAEELIDYLVANGDFWDQRRRRDGVTDMDCRPWNRDAAERFVRRGWAPSMVVTTTSAVAEIKTAKDGI